MTAADTVERPRSTAGPARLAFDLPPELEAAEPPEARGLTRDAVRMMVAHRASGTIEHSTFALLPAFLEPGDVVVVNTSGTIPAALDAVAADGTPLVVHLSTQLAADRWVVEVRRPAGRSTERWSGPPPPSPLSLGPDAVPLAGDAVRGRRPPVGRPALACPNGR